MKNSTSPQLSPERRRELGNSRGGRARVPKGLALLAPEERAKIIAKGLAARRRKAAQRAQKLCILDQEWTRSQAG